MRSFLLIRFALLLFFSGSVTVQAQIAALDVSFTQQGSGFNSQVYTIATQVDGKVIVGGNFTAYNGISRNRIARMNADGTLDESFVVGDGFNSTVNSVAVDENGKVIVVGFFTDYNGFTGKNRIVRLNPDGSLDQTFNTGTGFTGNATSVRLLPDGRMLVCGQFAQYNGSAVGAIARLNADGTRDNTFNQGGTGIGWAATATSLEVMPDGKVIVVSNNIGTYNGVTVNRMFRINADGSLDSSFDIGTGPNNAVTSAVALADGSVILGGNFTSFNDQPINRVVKLTPSGAIDPSFEIGTGFNNIVEDMELDAEGNLVCVGSLSNYNGVARGSIARLLPNGTLDDSFNTVNGFNIWANCLRIQEDGRIVVGGAFSVYAGIQRNGLARLLNHTVNATTVSPEGPFCRGGATDLSYEAIGIFGSSNVFTAQLSDANGNFSNAVDIGSVTATVSGTISVTIPSDAAAGVNYRMRVISSEPPVSGPTLGLTDNLTVVVPDPAVSISSDLGNEFCAGQDVTFTANPTDGGDAPAYQWFVNNLPVSGATESTFTTSTLQNGAQVRVRLTSNALCYEGEPVFSDNFVVTVNPSDELTATITADTDSVICDMQVVTFGVTAVNGGPNPTYQWKRNGNNVGSGQVTYTTSSLADGDVVTCEVTGTAECTFPLIATSNSLTFTVSSEVEPEVTITADPGNEVCAGAEVTFTATAIGGGTNPSFQWKINGVETGDDSPNYITTSLADGDIVTCTLSSSLFCAIPQETTSEPIEITLGTTASPSVTMSADPGTAICSSTEVTFTATATDAGAGPTYQWSVNGETTGDNSPVFTTSTLADGDEVTCTVTSSSPCADPATASASLEVTISEGITPQISVSGNALVCDGTATFTAEVTPAQTAPVFEWKINGSVVGDDSDTFTATSVNTGDQLTVTLIVDDPCVPSGFVTSEVIVLETGTTPVLSGTITGPSSTCAGETHTFSIAAATGAESYEWTLPEGWVEVSSTGATVTAVAGNTGGTVTVVAQSACGSSSPVTVDVSSFPNYATLSGGVTLGGVPVISGWVYVYRFNQPTEWWQTTGTKLDSAQINFGNYSFDEMPIYGEPFMLKAVVTGSQAGFHIPTFYAVTATGTPAFSPVWNTPQLNYILEFACGADETINISVLELQNTDGEAQMSGTVYWYGDGGKLEAEDPIPGVDVIVEKVPPGSAFSHATTDIEGRYAFTDVPSIPVSEYYRIFVSFPGIPMLGSGHEITVTPEDVQFTGLNFYVDTALNRITAEGPTSVESIPIMESDLRLLPNPMTDHMTVILCANMADATYFRLHDMTGATIKEERFAPSRVISIERHDMASGLYLLDIGLMDGAAVRERIMIH